jgi:hypothetical protein
MKTKNYIELLFHIMHEQIFKLLLNSKPIKYQIKVKSFKIENTQKIKITQKNNFLLNCDKKFCDLNKTKV